MHVTLILWKCVVFVIGSAATDFIHFRYLFGMTSWMESPACVHVYAVYMMLKKVFLGNLLYIKGRTNCLLMEAWVILQNLFLALKFPQNLLSQEPHIIKLLPVNPTCSSIASKNHPVSYIFIKTSYFT